MKFLPSKDQIIPALVVSLIAMAIVNRVAVLRKLVNGA